MRTDDHLQISESLDDAQWDAFVANTPGGHHVQTSLWALVKASLGWKRIRIAVRENEQIVAGCQILVRHYPLMGSVGYVTKGPLCSTEDAKLSNRVINQARRICREHHCQLLAIQPPNNGHYMSTLLAEQGFRRSSLELAPTASILIDLSPNLDQIFAQVKRQARQNINRSMREGITVHQGTKHDLETFYSLHLSTSERQKFMPYPKSYFDTMRRVLEPQGYFQILLAKFRDQPVSAVLLVPYKDTVIIKILGWSGLYRELRPNEALFWGTIQWAKKGNYHYVDLEGVDPAGARKALQGKPITELIRHSPDQLKYGFGGKITLYPEPYDLVYNPIYRWLYYKLKPQVASQSIISKVLDLFRKR